MIERDSENDVLFQKYLWLWEHTANLTEKEFDEALLKLKQKDSKSLRAKSRIALSEGLRCGIKPHLGNAYEKLNEAIELFRQLEDKRGEGAALSILVISYKSLGQLEKAQITAQTAIDYLKGYAPFLYFIQVAYYQSGEINFLLKDYSAAIEAYEEGLQYAEENDGNMAARLLNGIGNVYNAQNNFEAAYDYLTRSLKMIEGKKNILHESKIHADLGTYYFKKQDYENALKCQQKSIALREQNNLINPLLTNYIELAEIYLKLNNVQDALHYATLAEKKAIEFKVIIKQFEANLILSKIYEVMNEPQLALERYKMYHKLNDEVLGKENARKIKELSVNHNLESAQKEKEIFRLKNVVLKEALDEIESSVRYAKRIQEAILPPVSLIQARFPQAFVFYQPKDVVAGDFFWMEEINNTVFIAAADCTGHGVPGAMVSVVCCNALNRAVKEFGLSDPGKILDKVSDLVCETFEKSNEEVKDGMDISLLSVNKTTRRIQWSGANNPLWYFYNTEFHQIKANARPIGKSDNAISFTTHSIPFQTGTSFILFTDGYADQFGGEKGKKMMYKLFRETLQKSINLEPQHQRKNLESFFNTWKGSLEQVDDVCVIGIKLS